VTAPAARPAPRWLLRALTAALPLLLLAALEGGLRAAGFGQSLPLFVDAPAQPGYREVNPEVGRRFDVDPDAPLLTRADPVYFARAKPTRGLRIFVQGSSTAAGFPYGRFASLAGMLQARLQSALPERRVEVVQTAMSAVNSYALLDFSSEILAEAPDAVVIYAGHNEYLGMLGVGSTIAAGRSVWLTRSYLALRELRVFQLLQRGAAALRARLARPAAAGAAAARAPAVAGLMARVAGEKEIPLGSELYQRGLAQLRANLGALLARYRRAGIPVFLATLACNERHQPPFAGRAPAGAPAEDAADAWFERAVALDRAGDFAAARRAYLGAKDRDLLRFRAPEDANRVLRELAALHGAVLVDVQAALAADAPDGIIGRELMLEHLHPNLRGYFLLADAFFDALLASGALGAAAAARAEPDALAWERQPLSELDRRAGEYRVAELLRQWPFAPPAEGAPAPGGARAEAHAEDAIALLAARVARGELSWTEGTQQALALHAQRGEAAEAARSALNLADTFPRSPRARLVAARWLIETRRAREALWQLDRAAELAPSEPDLARALDALRARAERLELRDL